MISPQVHVVGHFGRCSKPSVWRRYYSNTFHGMARRGIRNVRLSREIRNDRLSRGIRNDRLSRFCANVGPYQRNFLEAYAVGSRINFALYFDCRNIFGSISQASQVSAVYKNRMLSVFKAVGDTFDQTIEWKDLFQFWFFVSRFITDLQVKCTEETFMLHFIAWIGPTLLNRFLKVGKVRNFDDKAVIYKAMLNCLQCGSVLAKVVAAKKSSRLRKRMYSHHFHCIDEYFDLIGYNAIFLSDIFYKETATILESGMYATGSTSLWKYLDIMSHYISRSDTAGTMFRYCTGSRPIKHLVKLTWLRHGVDKSQRMMVLKILADLLTYVIRFFFKKNK